MQPDGCVWGTGLGSTAGALTGPRARAAALPRPTRQQEMRVTDFIGVASRGRLAAMGDSLNHPVNQFMTEFADECMTPSQWKPARGSVIERERRSGSRTLLDAQLRRGGWVMHGRDEFDVTFGVGVPVRDRRGVEEPDVVVRWVADALGRHVTSDGVATFLEEFAKELRADQRVVHHAVWRHQRDASRAGAGQARRPKRP